MGSADQDLSDSRPAHRVAVKSFQMAKTLVTNKQYDACVAAGACSAAHISDGTCSVDDGKEGWSLSLALPNSFQNDDQPAVCVTWAQAEAFSEWVGGRLPSEAEWEYAARSAGKDWKYPWGDEVPTCARALTKGCGEGIPAPVCSRPAGNTRQGLCDMAGGDWELVQDVYHESYDGAPADGRAWEIGTSSHVQRGGSKNDDSATARCAYREPSSGVTDNVGFRPVR
jgi:formylglycine-generating enzyme required for sulfatase activity